MKDIDDKPPEDDETPKAVEPQKRITPNKGIVAIQGEVVDSDLDLDANEFAQLGPDDPRFSRPTYYRKGVRDQVFDSAKDSQGLVRDPLTGDVIDPDEPWDMGHKPGYEFRKHQKSAAERGISRKEFLDEYNNPDDFQPELPSSNRSHKGELLDDTYFGL